MKKFVFLLILFAINCLNAQINVLESNLVLQNGVFYYNNSPFTGNALVYYPQDQIKSICEYREGLKTGNFTSYYLDNNFNKINFKDTSKINQFAVKKSVLKDQINQSIKDSVDSYIKMTSYLEDEIGGEKKLLKFKEKSVEGDLKGKKLEEFNTYNNYVNKHNSVIQLLKQQQLALQNNEEKLNTELSKKEFFGISKEQYQQKNGIKDGVYISHFENGKLEKECNYVDGKLNGGCKSYYSNGKLSSEGTYLDGKFNDSWTFYYENGNIKGKGNFKMSDGTDLGSTGISRNGREGNWEFFYENTNLKEELNFVESKLNGECKFYYSSGILKEEGNYFDGKTNGVYKWYYENSKLRQEGNYINGKTFGLFKIYYPTGVMNAEENFKDDLREGICKYYYENGKLEKEVNYNGGIKNGIYKWYRDNGKLKQEGFYNNGKFYGLFKTYYPSGILREEENLKDDLREGICKYYYENGKLEMEAIFKGDIKNGSYKRYYDNGKLKHEGNYSEGEKKGIFKEYFDSGVLSKSVNYDPSSLHEEHIIGDVYHYDKDGKLIRHWFVSKNGVVEDKMNSIKTNSSNTNSSNTNSSNTNSSEENKPYNCKCCKNKINGLKEGVDKNGSEYDNKYISVLEKAFNMEKEMAHSMGIPYYSNFYDRLRYDYKYCKMECARDCKEE